MKVLWTDPSSEWAAQYGQPILARLKSLGIEATICYAETICEADDRMAENTDEPFDLLVLAPETPLGALSTTGCCEVLPYSNGTEFAEWHAKQNDLPPTVVYSGDFGEEDRPRLTVLTGYIFLKPAGVEDLVEAFRAVDEVNKSCY